MSTADDTKIKALVDQLKTLSVEQIKDVKKAWTALEKDEGKTSLEDDWLAYEGQHREARKVQTEIEILSGRIARKQLAQAVPFGWEVATTMPRPAQPRPVYYSMPYAAHGNPGGTNMMGPCNPGGTNMMGPCNPGGTNVMGPCNPGGTNVMGPCNPGGTNVMGPCTPGGTNMMGACGPGGTNVMGPCFR